MKVLLTAAALALGISSAASASAFLVDVEAIDANVEGTLHVDSAIDTTSGYDAHAIVGFLGTYDGEAASRVLNNNFPLPSTLFGQLFDEVYTTDLDGVVGPSFGPFGAIFCTATARCVHLGSGNGDGVQFKTFTFQTGWVSAGHTNLTFTPQAVPEPATWALMILGFGTAGAMLRRRQFGGVSV